MRDFSHSLRNSVVVLKYSASTTVEISGVLGGQIDDTLKVSSVAA
jgi:hypothetical protein